MLDGAMMFCSDLTSATPDKCSNKFSTIMVELQWLIARWSLIGKGDKDVDGHTADKDKLGSLSCSQGALDSRSYFQSTITDEADGS